MSQTQDDVAALRWLNSPAACAVIGEALARPALREKLGLGKVSTTESNVHVSVACVHHRPGISASVCFLCRETENEAENEARVLHVVASTLAGPGSGGEAQLDTPVGTITLWQRARDPFLPALVHAVDADTICRWLDLDSAGEITLDVLSYRPTRRAVIRVRAGQRAYFLKVLPKTKAANLYTRHDLLTRAGVKAPQVLAQPLAGVLVLAAGRGKSLAQALANSATAPQNVPDASAVVRWLDSLPKAIADLPPRPSWVDRIDFHASAARATLHDQAGRIGAVEEGIRDVLAQRPRPVIVATHGDFYEANILVRAGEVSDVIDLDSLGPGAREDDLATLLGHMAVLAKLAPDVYLDSDDIVLRWFTDFARDYDPASLAARVAAVVLSLIAGAEAGQAQARLDIAESWLARAGSLATATSGRQARPVR